MSDKDIQRLKELAEKKLTYGMSREKALRSLERADHLDNPKNLLYKKARQLACRASFYCMLQTTRN